MVNYSNGKIYKIIDNTNGNIYIGSTTETLSRRLVCHRSKYKCHLLGKAEYVSSFEILKNNNYNIILIEKYNCNDKDELLARERYHIENNKCVNLQIPGRDHHNYNYHQTEKAKETSKEWYEKNKKTIRKKWVEENKEKIIKQKKVWSDKRRAYNNSWGGDMRRNCNLLLIDINLFA